MNNDKEQIKEPVQQAANTKKERLLPFLSEATEEKIMMLATGHFQKN